MQWMRRRPALATAAIVLLALAVSGAGLTLAVEREQVRDLITLNPSGAAGRTLIVYHPGLSDFPDDVAMAFADGLIANGWQVDITTASAYAPRDLAHYDVLALVSPTYWWTPARPVLRYIDRIGKLDGKRVAIIITASGQPDRSRGVMEDKVRAAGGEVVTGISLTKWKPNRQGDPRPNNTVALEIARQAGQAIPLPRLSAQEG